MKDSNIMNKIGFKDNIDKDVDKCIQQSEAFEKVRNHNVGNSDYSKHNIQPWDIWIEYRLNPFDADIVKRILRKKGETGMSEQESRKMDYQKIIHICEERIRQIDEGIEL